MSHRVSRQCASEGALEWHRQLVAVRPIGPTSGQNQRIICVASINAWKFIEPQARDTMDQRLHASMWH